jgi:hypothetical protein
MLETQLIWRSEDQSAALTAFIEVASGVFAPVGQAASGR